ncbi:hypothetical protein ACWF5Z_23510, partial [Bacillus subtilis]
CWESALGHAVILVSGHTETAVMAGVWPAETCVSRDVTAAIRASSAGSTPGLRDPLLACPRTQPATVWMVAVPRGSSVRVWDPVSGLAISRLTPDGPTPPGHVLPLDTGLAGLSMHRRNAAVALLACSAEAVDEEGWLNAAVLQGLHPGERAVVFAYAAAAGREWEEAAAVLGVRDPAAVGERLRRTVNQLAAEQQRRTAQRRAECPSAPTEDPGYNGLNTPLAAMPSAL